MKKLIASVAAAALVATPALAATTTTKTTTTKVTPASPKGQAHARVKRHTKHHVAKKTVAKKSTETTKS